MIHASTAQVTAYTTCVFVWSMWSEPAPSEDKIVVSDNGEQWSPNVAPPITAPTVAYTVAPNSPPVIENANGITIGTRIAHVPHDEPVRNEMIAHTKNEIVTKSAGVIQSSVMLRI